MWVQFFIQQSVVLEQWNRFEKRSYYRSMRRNCFDQITRSLHFNDNAALDYTNKYSKLQSLIHYLQKEFMVHFVLTQNISHDEAMVEYFGKHTVSANKR